MATKYPQYRVTQWLDTSEESMSKPQATIIYGVQTKRQKGGVWMNCMNRNGPLHYATHEKASEAVAALRASEATTPEPATT